MYAVTLATVPLTRAAPMVTLAGFAESDQIVTGSADQRVIARAGIDDIIGAGSQKQFREI